MEPKEILMLLLTPAVLLHLPSTTSQRILRLREALTLTEPVLSLCTYLRSQPLLATPDPGLIFVPGGIATKVTRESQNSRRCLLYLLVLLYGIVDFTNIFYYSSKHVARHKRPHQCRYGPCSGTGGKPPALEGRRFALPSDLQRHIETVHKDLPEVAASLKNRSYYCVYESCNPNKQYPRCDNFRTHLKSRHGCTVEESAKIIADFKLAHASASIMNSHAGGDYAENESQDTDQMPSDAQGAMDQDMSSSILTDFTLGGDDQGNMYTPNHTDHMGSMSIEPLINRGTPLDPRLCSCGPAGTGFEATDVTLDHIEKPEVSYVHPTAPVGTQGGLTQAPPFSQPRQSHEIALPQNSSRISDNRLSSTDVLSQSSSQRKGKQPENGNPMLTPPEFIQESYRTTSHHSRQPTFRGTRVETAIQDLLSEIPILESELGRQDVASQTGQATTAKIDQLRQEVGTLGFDLVRKSQDQKEVIGVPMCPSSVRGSPATAAGTNCGSCVKYQNDPAKLKCVYLIFLRLHPSKKSLANN